MTAGYSIWQLDYIDNQPCVLLKFCDLSLVFYPRPIEEWLDQPVTYMMRLADHGRHSVVI